MRRVLLGWVIGFALLILAFFGTVALLDSTVFSAHGFVSSYLDALNRHDATTARELPGVHAVSGEGTNLLTDGSLASIQDIRLVHDTVGGDGIHRVVFDYRLGTQPGSTTFYLTQTPSFLGLFSRWQFEKSPLATVSVTTPDDPRFRANGTDVTTTVKEDHPQSYVVFTPGLYVFDHKSMYLTASPVDIPVTEPGSVTPVRVEAEPNHEFISEVTKELHQFYVTCAKQTVLLPTSCPFGKSFANRVISTPHWSMVTDPPVTIIPYNGSWSMPYSTGQVHLVVKVQSLFDGSISTFDANVPFTVAYTITIGPANHLTITSLSTN